LKTWQADWPIWARHGNLIVVVRELDIGNLVLVDFGRLFKTILKILNNIRCICITDSTLTLLALWLWNQIWTVERNVVLITNAVIQIVD
jgi:hypothetical protein